MTYVVCREKLSQGSNVTICQVHHMNIVPYLNLYMEKERRVSFFAGKRNISLLLLALSPNTLLFIHFFTNSLSGVNMKIIKLFLFSLLLLS